MEVTVSEARTVESNKHSFYCDECGGFLGESYEYDDGYYKSIGEYTWQYYDNICGWIHKKGNYCPKCQAEVAKKIMSVLENLGFRQYDDF